MFTGILHPYQDEGVDKAVARGSLLIAYGMGTGKTPIALATLEELMGRGRVRTALIVVPAALRWQWAAQVAKFTDTGARQITLKGTTIMVPDADYCQVLDGTPTKRTAQYAQIREHRPDYVIAGYETVLSDFKHIRRIAPDAIVLDEAQAIKNAGARRTKRIKRLHAPYRFALTGTPMDNGKAEEIFSIMEWVDPEVFGRPDLFDRCYVVRNRYGRVLRYINLDVLHQTLAPAMARKTINDPDVAARMPRVEHERIGVVLDPATRKSYEQIEQDLRDALEQAREHGASTLDVEAFYAGAPQGASPALGAVAARMTAARLLLCHPRLLEISRDRYRQDKPGGSAYAARFVEHGHLHENNESPKLRAACAYVEKVLMTPGAKVIVFSTFREMLPLLAEALDLGPYGSVQYHGELASGPRAAAIARFMNDPHCRVFLSTDAGGSGLDLPVASHVLHYDLPAGVGAWQQRGTRHTRANSPHPVVHTAELVALDTVDEHHAARLAGALAVARAGVDAIEHPRAHDRASLSEHLSTARSSNEQPSSSKSKPRSSSHRAAAARRSSSDREHRSITASSRMTSSIR